MKKIAILLFLLTVISCNRIKENLASQKDWEEIKSSNNLFHFSSFAIEHPTSEHLNGAIKKHIAISDSLTKLYGHPSCGILSAEIYHNNTDTVMFHHELVHIDNLSDKVYEYLLSKRVNTSSHTYKIDGFDKKMKRSHGHIYFPIDSIKLKNNHYQKSIEQIAKGIKKYENHLVVNVLHKKITELNEVQKQSIREEMSYKLSFWPEEMNPFTNPPLPPPAPLP